MSGCSKLTRDGLDEEGAIVEGGDGLLHPAEGLAEGEAHLHDEVDPVPLEGRVLLLVQHDDDVSGLEPGLLVALPAEGDLLAVLHTLVHRDLEDLALARDLAAGALFAAQLGVDPLSLTLALSAHGLDLLHHAGSQLLDANLVREREHVV